MTCCGFGHRDVFQNIDKELCEAVQSAVSIGCDVFYTGAMGDFDRCFSSAVRKQKKKAKLVCVKPYMSNELNTNKQYYNDMYDDIIIPDELAFEHYKSAITKRNRWMIDNSDIVIVYVIKNYGGAYDAMRYAERQNKTVVKIEKKI